MTQDEFEPQPLRIIGTPYREDGQFKLREHAIVGRECGWICPRCNNEVRILPATTGWQQFACGFCKTSYQVQVFDNVDTFTPGKKAAAIPPPPIDVLPAPTPMPAPTPTPAVAETVVGTIVSPMAEKLRPKTPSTGVLQWGRLFSKKTSTLYVGSNIIGRNDDQCHSDIEFDDPEMSRRSVDLKVIELGIKSYVFTFSVFKALNPVTVNGQEVPAGQTVRLNSGDVICMGQTTMTFKQSK